MVYLSEGEGQQVGTVTSGARLPGGKDAGAIAVVRTDIENRNAGVTVRPPKDGKDMPPRQGTLCEFPLR